VNGDDIKQLMASDQKRNNSIKVSKSQGKGDIKSKLSLSEFPIVPIT
jgi:hypothetical protein